MKFSKEALDVVEMNYADLKEIADDMLSDFFNPVNKIIDSLGNNINTLSLDTIRDVMTELSISSFKISEIKDKTGIKAEIAEAIRKEQYAIEHNKCSGTVATKENTALLESSQQIVVELLYQLVSNLSKTKLDEIHRVVDVLKTVLMSRMQEMKITMSSIE